MSEINNERIKIPITANNPLGTWTKVKLPYTLMKVSNYLKILRSKQSRTFITVVKKLKHDVSKYN